ncbi:MAG: VTC domain-containing protein, partial [Sandaracinaceae bacterium]|nr:VTC domain-containing protein [Sandaracinaceae bacterium]
RNRRNLDSFAHLLAQSGAEPKVLVRYDREAYVSEVDEYARVTFDRRICAAPATDWELSWDRGGWHYVDGARRNLPLSITILELKCETRMPVWMMELVRDFDLRRRGFSKYSSGVDVVSAFEAADPSVWGLDV